MDPDQTAWVYTVCWKGYRRQKQTTFVVIVVLRVIRLLCTLMAENIVIILNLRGQAFFQEFVMCFFFS